MIGDAVISPNKLYRYVLTRGCTIHQLLAADADRFVHFIMLNPSTADSRLDDPTIRRCIGFAERWGFDRLAVTNLFAFRTSKPQQLLRSREPIGSPQNEHWTDAVARRASKIVCAWGNNGWFYSRDGEMIAWLKKQHYTLYHLGLTNSGQPRHPLMLRNDTELQRWV